jgi:hypothetical protein
VDDHIWYIRGYPDGSVQPDGNITRAEVTMIFFRLMSDPAKNDARAPAFADVPADEWYAQAVNYMAEKGIVIGDEDGTFRPDDYITRGEFATIASRFDNLLVHEGEPVFSDVAGHWAERFIASAAEKGWVHGYPDGTFGPDRSITRAEVVTTVNNMLHREIELADIPPSGIPIYTDITEAHWAYCDIIEASVAHVYDRKVEGVDAELWSEWQTGDAVTTTELTKRIVAQSLQGGWGPSGG